jgi:protein phosphatase
MTGLERIRLQTQSSSIDASGVSDPGQIRSYNEDSLYLDPRGGFLLLADGMGGHELGDLASHTALEVIRGFFTTENIESEMMDITDGCGMPPLVSCAMSLVDSAVNEANTTIYSLNLEKGLTRFMGTTVTGVLLLQDQQVVWFHVGDSRIYRWRDNTLESLTEDHSAYMDWIRQGKVGAEPHKNIITRAIGPTPAVSVTTGWAEYLPGDVYLLCSDGLTDMIGENKIGAVLAEGTSTGDIADRLVDDANNAGGKDNVSVIVCRI